MELKPSYGIDNVIFGMTETDIIELLGNPDKIYEDEDDDRQIVYQYNQNKLTLTFYTEENGKLGYIQSSNTDITFQGNPILDLPISKVKDHVFGNKTSDWEKEDYNFFEVYFNEHLWLTLNVEYGLVTDIELGVQFKNDYEYDWKK